LIDVNGVYGTNVIVFQNKPPHRGIAKPQGDSIVVVSCLSLMIDIRETVPNQNAETCCFLANIFFVDLT
jgi:hypothetical protein